MSTTTRTEDPVRTEPDEAPASWRWRRILFWIRRYLPAEVAGTATMFGAGLAVSLWSSAPAAVAGAAVLGELVGFYAVLAISVFVEQWQHVRGTARSRTRASSRTLLLLVAEFGPAELLDSLLVRPLALVAGVWLLRDPFWGLLAGKLAADIVFYLCAAGSFVLTDRTGLRVARGRETTENPGQTSMLAPH